MDILYMACLILAYYGSYAFADDSQRLRLKILKHQPCTSGSPNERIRFPNNAESPLLPDRDRGDGCYTLKGTVRVSRPISGPLQLYVQSKYGTSAPLEDCKGADQNGCGGVGSCVYCNACEGVKELGKSAVQLIIGNKPMDCKKGLVARNYSDIKISFCMPTKREFLKNQNIDEDFWNRFGASGQTVFLTVYVFSNHKINSLSRDELAKIATPDSDQVIGCHKLVGSIYESNS